MRGGEAGRAELTLAVVTLVWGSSFTLIKQALGDVSVLLFLTLRFALAGAVLLALYRRALALDWAAQRRGVRGGLVCGGLLTGAYLLQTYGQQYTTPARSGFLTALNVVFVPALLAAITGRLPRWTEALGVGLALAGTALMTLSVPGQAWGHWNLGDLLTIGCALLFAVHVMAVGHFVRQEGVFAALSGVQVAVVAVLCGAAAGMGLEPVVFRSTAWVWAGVVVTGLLCTALAFTVMAWAQQHTTPTRVALIFALEPVSAWLTSYGVLGERLGLAAAGGAVLILAGVGVVEWKPATRRVSPGEEIQGHPRQRRRTL